MTDLLPLVKELRDYVTYLAKSAEEERKAQHTIRENYLQDPEMESMCQSPINRVSYLNGKAHSLYDILYELNHILALAEKVQEEKEAKLMNQQNANYQKHKTLKSEDIKELIETLNDYFATQMHAAQYERASADHLISLCEQLKDFHKANLCREKRKAIDEKIDMFNQAVNMTKRIVSIIENQKEAN